MLFFTCISYILFAYTLNISTNYIQTYTSGFQWFNYDLMYRIMFTACKLALCTRSSECALFPGVLYGPWWVYLIEASVFLKRNSQYLREQFVYVTWMTGASDKRGWVWRPHMAKFDFTQGWIYLSVLHYFHFWAGWQDIFHCCFVGHEAWKVARACRRSGGARCDDCDICCLGSCVPEGEALGCVFVVFKQLGCA